MAGVRHPFIRLVLLRLSLGLATLFVVSVLTFIVTNVLPGDPARARLGIFVTPERREAFRERQGLDRPPIPRYFEWAGGLISGDWGTSLVDDQSVAQKVLPRLERTLKIGLLGALVALPLALGLGVYSAQRSGRPVDVGLSFVSILVASLPEFVVALVLLLVFAAQLGVLPVSSSAVEFGSTGQRLAAYVLPSLAVALVTFPYLYRLVRANVRDTLAADFVRNARLRGVPRRRLLRSHVLPNATLPLIGAGLLALADVLGGLIVIENVFSFPGIGQLLVESTQSGDTPTVQAIVLVFTVGYVSLNLIADVIGLVLNPRLRQAGVS